MNTQDSSSALRAQLLQAGFATEGTNLVLRLPVRDMPYAMEHIVPDSDASELDTAVLLVNEHDMLTFSIGAHYSEESVPLDSEDAMGVLRDAGVSVTH